MEDDEGSELQCLSWPLCSRRQHGGFLKLVLAAVYLCNM